VGNNYSEWYALMYTTVCIVEVVIVHQYYIQCICHNIGKKNKPLRKSKYWLARNQDNVSDCGNMSIHGLLFQLTSNIKIQLSVLVLYKADLIIISLKIILVSIWSKFLKNRSYLKCWKFNIKVLLHNNWIPDRVKAFNAFPCEQLYQYLQNYFY
jgi:hypothetical protein